MRRILLTWMATLGFVALPPAFGAWDGTTTDTAWYTEAAADTVTYNVGTPEQLAGLAKLVNAGITFEGKTVKLTANADLGGKPWTPIGDGARSGSGHVGNAFRGTFNGGYKTISNLAITDAPASADAALGLFGVVAGGTVKSLSLEGVGIAVPTSECVGAAVGLMVENAAVSFVNVKGGTVSAARGVGGVVGRMTRQGSIGSCTNAADVRATGANAGGIVGAAYYTDADASKTMTIASCKNTGVVSSTAGVVGGIVGLSAATVNNCTNSAAVTGAGASVGGVVGEQQNFGAVTACTNSGAVANDGADTAYGTGGIVGWVRYSGAAAAYPTKAVITVSGNANSGAVSGKNDAGGIVGALYNAGAVTQNRNTAPAIGSKNFAAGIVGNIQYDSGSAFYEEKGDVSVTGNISTTPDASLTGPNKAAYAYDNDKGEGTNVSFNFADAAGEDLTVATLGELKAFRDAVNVGVSFQRHTVTLGADIDLGNEEWTPIGTKDKPFSGTFDGAGKTVSNLTVTGSKSYVGFFGRTVGATLKNLTVSNVAVKGSQYVAGLSGNAYTGTVEACHVTGSIAIAGSKYVGGVTGSSYAALRNCSVKATTPEQGTISGTSDNVGGMIGYRAETSGKTEGCSVSNVRVSGQREVGGLAGVGYCDNRYIACSVENVTVVCTAAAVSAYNANSYGYGGLVGALNNGGGAYKGGTFEGCSVSGVALEIPEALADKVSAGVVLGGVRDDSNKKEPPRGVAAEDNISADITVSGANTGANNDYLIPYVAAIGETKYLSVLEAIAAAKPGDTVTLVADAAVPPLGDGQGERDVDLSGVTLDLNGKTLTCPFMSFCVCGTDVTVRNGTLSGGGASYALFVGGEDYATKGVTVESVSMAGGINIFNASDVVLRGGDATVTAKGYYAVWCDQGVSGVRIESGRYVAEETVVNITNGYDEANLPVAAEGGTYSPRPESKYCAEGFVAMPSEEGAYAVVEGEWAATVGGEKYATLQEAVAAAEAADPAQAVTLLRDVTLGAEVTLTKDIPLDLAGHNLYAKDAVTPAFVADSAVKVTVTAGPADGAQGKVIAAAQSSSSNVTLTTAAIAAAKWTDEGAYDATWFTGSDPSVVTFELKTAEQVAGLAWLLSPAADEEWGEAVAGFAGMTVILGADIDLSALEWEPIRSFDGTLKGGNHTVRGLRTTVSAGAGLFAKLSGTVESLRLREAKVNVKAASGRVSGNGGVFAGALAGGALRACAAEACAVSVASENGTATAIGGLVGQASGNATLGDCAVAADVVCSGAPALGAFAGKAEATVRLTACWADATAAPVGGTALPKMEAVYGKGSEGRFVRHGTAADGTRQTETLGESAALNGIGWLLNGQSIDAADAAVVWRVDSNATPSALLPFAAGKVTETPAVEPWLTKVVFGGKAIGYFANGHEAVVEEVEGKTLLRAWRADYLTDETLGIDGTKASYVYGGNFRGPTLASTALTLRGGTLSSVYGGSYEASVTDSRLAIEGGTVTQAIGGCAADAANRDLTTETSSLTISGGKVYIACGGGAAGCYGVPPEGAAAPHAYRLGDVTTTVTGGQVDYLYGGSGSGYLYAENVTLKVTGGTFKEVIGGSSHGEVGAVSMTLGGSAIVTECLFAVNRGEVGSVAMTLGAAFNPKAGICLSNCLESDDTTGQIAVNGSVTLTNNAAGQAPVYFGSALGQAATVTLGGTAPLAVFAQASATKGGEVAIPAAQTLTLGSGVTLTVPSGVTLAVEGAVNVETGAALVGADGTASLDTTGSVSGIASGVTVWSPTEKAWVGAVAMSADGTTYYATVAAAIAANPGAGVRLFSRDFADEAVSAISSKTVTAGDAYDVADVLGGTFKVNGTALVYDYDLGVSGLTIRGATEGDPEGETLMVEVAVKLTEGDVPAARTLEGRTLTVTSALGEESQTFTRTGELVFGADGICKVAIPYSKMGKGTNRLTVSVAKDAATP